MQPHHTCIIIYTGGTLGCVGQPLAPLAADTFIPLLQQHIQSTWADVAHTTWHTLTTPHIKDSSDLNPQDWIALHQLILDTVERTQCHRVVVIHGTDTLSYTAQFLHHTLPAHITVCLTGSMQPLFEQHTPNHYILKPNSDAARHVHDALTCALNPNIQGVWVALQQQCWPAAYVYKDSTQQGHAFRAVRAFNTQPPRLNHFFNITWHTGLLHAYAEYLQQPGVHTLFFTPFSTLTHYNPLLSTTCTAWLYAGFGNGNLPHTPQNEAWIRQVTAKGDLVVISSQVPDADISGTYATSHWLNAYPVVFAPHANLSALSTELSLFMFLYHHTTHTTNQPIHRVYQQFLLSAHPFLTVSMTRPTDENI